nr:MAG TPA: AAA domain protein [Caudoviricetes sp.]
MRIRKIEFVNHPILGSIVFDFTGKDGKTVDTIIIAGENGVGKTVLLDTLFNNSPISLYDDLSGEIKQEIELSNKEIEILSQDEQSKQLFSNGIRNNTIYTHQQFQYINDWEQSTLTFTDSQGEERKDYGHIIAKALKVIYSSVEINFTPIELNTVTAKNIDEENVGLSKSSSELATEITQLLIDIQSQDAMDLSSWVTNHQGIAPPAEVQNIRMKRFTKAFHTMFPHKRFKEILNKNNTKKVIFTEGGKDMPIEKLSSGEKQIVFRGGFFLKNKASINGALALIDEPEISLHPRWQISILEYFKSLFKDEKGNMTSQIIVTTHSPFIIHNSNRYNDKVIILKKDDKGIISVSDKSAFYNWSEEELIKEAFYIEDIQKDKVTVFVEGETDEQYFNKALKLFYPSNTTLVFKWIGRKTAQDKAENTGDKALNNARALFMAHPTFISNRVVLLYDCDTNKPEENNAKLYIRSMVKNSSNTLYKKGAENLLVLPLDFDPQLYYSTIIKQDDYGAESTIRNLDKTKLCDYLCGLPEDKLKSIFTNFKNEIDNIISIK